jgi:hypothetical protein
VALHLLVKGSFEKKPGLKAKIRFDLRILLSKMRVWAGTNDLQRRARFPMVFYSKCEEDAFLRERAERVIGRALLV